LHLGGLNQRTYLEHRLHAHDLIDPQFQTCLAEELKPE